MASVKIDVEGLTQFQRNVKRIDSELAKDLRKLLNVIAGDVADLARPQVPRRSGRAAASLKAASTQKAARVKGGGARAPYYPWLDFGGSVGRRDSIKRSRVAGGRYIYPALGRERPTLRKKLFGLLQEMAEAITNG